MKTKGFMTAILAALLASAPISNFMMPPSAYRNRGASKRRKTGTRYPHSNTSQRARYARQIAAGQLNMEGARNG